MPEEPQNSCENVIDKLFELKSKGCFKHITKDLMDGFSNSVNEFIDPLMTYDQAKETFNAKDKRQVYDAVNNKALKKEKPFRITLGRFSMFKKVLGK